MDVDYDTGSGSERVVYKVKIKGPALAVVYGW